MLRSLSIENIAVIEHADIEFDNGFSVLSGETGAGKSMIIDSINAILGQRISRELIRTGAPQASVSAVFDQIEKDAVEKARQLGFDVHNDKLRISRQMFPDGRNVCRINGKTAALAALRELSVMLVSIHGQHDGQNLLDEDKHIDYLDAFAGLEPELRVFSAKYDDLLRLNRNIRSLSLSNSEKDRRIALLSEYVPELEKADIHEGEYQQLLSLRSSLMRTQRAGTALREALQYISGDDDSVGALSLVGDGIKILAQCQDLDSDAPGILDKAKDAAELLSDLSSELSSCLYRLEFSPQQLADTEQRLDLVITLSERHKTEPDRLPELLDEFRSELDALVNSDDNLEELKEQYAKKRAEVFSAAQKLTEKRRKAAGRLSSLICDELRQLDMPSVRMEAEIESQSGPKGVRFSRKGIDSVRFLLSANKGEGLKPLNKVASGGELSRIMLAMKKVLSAGEPVCTAIFDEIDTGVSGRAANKVGQKLYEISCGRQVLCITHLPQIACLADHHFRITKHEAGGRTFTDVESLEAQGRMEEIARLTSGLNITQSSMESAGEMLRLAGEYKKSLTK